MIVTVEELKSQIECDDMTDTAIQSQLTAIEAIIRKYTHNNFQMPAIRFEAETSGNIIKGSSPYIKAGDTLQITQSAVNNGLYVVESITEAEITVDKPLYDWKDNRITKIEYPPDVKQVAIDMFKWKLEFGGKIGVKSEAETLSRHSVSVTYEDSNALYMGYPKGLLSALSLYVKARCWN